MFQLVQWATIAFQLGVANFNANSKQSRQDAAPTEEWLMIEKW
jgi:hypothetical protein